MNLNTLLLLWAQKRDLPNAWRWSVSLIYSGDWNAPFTARYIKALNIGSLRIWRDHLTYSYGISSPLFTIRWRKSKEERDYYGIGRGRFFTWYGFGYWEKKPRYLKDWTDEMRRTEKI